MSRPRPRPAFETPELLSISDEKMEEFYREPELELYRRYFDKSRSRRAHILSATEEKAAGRRRQMSQSPQNIFSMFSNADLEV